VLLQADRLFLQKVFFEYPQEIELLNIMLFQLIKLMALLNKSSIVSLSLKTTPNSSLYVKLGSALNERKLKLVTIANLSSQTICLR
jgi:hypothetical protein